MDNVEVICPECSNIGSTSGQLKRKKCFYSVSKDCWHCYQCDARGAGHPEKISSKPGTLLQFRAERPQFEGSEKLVSDLHKAFLESERAKEYIKRRFGGVLPEFDFGWDAFTEMVVIPVRDFDRKLVGIKYRAIEDSAELRYTSMSGSRSGSFVLPGKTKDLLICEGEFDAIAAKAMGFEGWVCATQTNRISENVKTAFEAGAREDRDVWICPDADEAGSALLESAERLLPQGYGVLRLPEGVKDLAAFMEQFKEEAKAEFAKCLLNCKTEIEAQTYTGWDKIVDMHQYLTDNEKHPAWSTGFPLLDDRLGGGFLPHTLTALSAPAKTGKTTLIVQLIYNIASQGHKAGFISLEMDPTRYVMPSFFSIAFKKNFRKLPASEVGELLNSGHEALEMAKRVYFPAFRGVTASERIDLWIRTMHKKHGIGMFFLDHVGYSLRDIKDITEHSALSKCLRAITEELPIHIVAIVQPRQMQQGQKFITKNDLYGSITWSQDINQLLTLEKGKEDDQSFLRLNDAHSPLARPSEEAIILFYHRATCSVQESFTSEDE